jgi:hypothetical protein
MILAIHLFRASKRLSSQNVKTTNGITNTPIRSEPRQSCQVIRDKATTESTINAQKSTMLIFRPIDTFQTAIERKLLLLRPRTIGINSALDLCDPLLMTEDHLRDLNDSPHENRRNRNQPNAKIEDRSYRTRPSTTRSGGADRDRTGGLLVANQALSQLSYSPNTVSSFTFPVSSNET